MRVALDARKAYDGGIGRYVRCVSATMLELDPSLEFVLLAPDDMPSWLEGPRVRRERFTAKPYSAGELIRAAPLLRRLDVDLFHEPHYVLPLAPGVPSVVTIHDLIHWKHPNETGRRFAGPYARAMIRSAIARARGVLTVSETTRADLVSLCGASPDRVFVTPLGVDERFFQTTAAEVDAVREERGLSRPYVLAVGAFKPHKDVPALLRAFAAADLPDADLVLAGSPAPPELVRLARELELTTRVRFLAGLPDDRLRALYRGARVFAIPSRSEGFGLPLLEAMASGVPAIATSIGALVEVGDDAVRVVPPGEPAALAAALAELWADEAARAVLSARAVARARSFTWRETARLTLEAYRTLAAPLRTRSDRG